MHPADDAQRSSLHEHRDPSRGDTHTTWEESKRALEGGGIRYGEEKIIKNAQSRT
jgi:hypothetical protein